MLGGGSKYEKVRVEKLDKSFNKKIFGVNSEREKLNAFSI